jgi:membrane protein
MIKRVKRLGKILHDSLQLLMSAQPLILASSTAFFATFSISPILILLVNFFGLYFKSENLSHLVFAKLGATIGYRAAKDIEVIVNNFMDIERTWWMSIAGLLFFIFIATTLFEVVKTNIHKLWRIRKSVARMRHRFRERMTLLILILVTGGLVFVSVTIDSSLAISLDYMQTVLPHVGIVLVRLLNFVFSIIVVTVWFTLIFKILPNAKVDWDIAFNGAFLTALLFNVGRFALGKILVHARIASIFGASASFALLLLFIFYCSFILYFGAAFTHEYAEYHERHICAGKNASEYQETLLSDRLTSGSSEKA